ncbi:MAG: hypothetical protein N3E47_08495, partial [Candidatus Bathyarchaeota archaeon]|nr:hypothetical protein [Candidatus Bathyarchaeota archaeon]
PEDFWARITSEEEEESGTKLFSYDYEKAEKPLTEEKSPSFYFGAGYAFTQENEESTWVWEREKEENPFFLAEERREEEKKEEESLPFSFKEEERREANEE